MGSINPLARLIGFVLFSTLLLFTIDWVSALVAIVLELVVYAATGVKLKPLLIYISALLILTPLTAVSMLLYGQVGGEVYWQWGLIHVSDNSIRLAIALSLRVIALALPAFALFADTDPIRMADALAQNAKLPARFVISTLTAVRMAAQLRRDWQSLAQARRARGLADSGWFQRVYQMTFTLLVFALRRASQVATAMETRGFGAAKGRTWARPSPWRLRDTMAIIVATCLGIVALGAAVWTGTFRWFGM